MGTSKKYPMVISSEEFRPGGLLSTSHAEVEGSWYLARPEGLTGLRNRIRCAWMVFTGRADALVWGGKQ